LASSPAKLLFAYLGLLGKNVSKGSLESVGVAAPRDTINVVMDAQFRTRRRAAETQSIDIASLTKIAFD
jgi:aspartate carbamoyltransferase regulatory subunit